MNSSRARKKAGPYKPSLPHVAASPHTVLEKQIAKSFGKAIWAARRRRGLSRSYVANLFEIDASHIRLLEFGRRLPYITELLVLASIYAADVMKLFREACHVWRPRRRRRTSK